jgi:hypothetical protein
MLIITVLVLKNFTFSVGFIAFITITVVFYIQPLCDYCHGDIEVGNIILMCLKQGCGSASL